MGRKLAAAVAALVMSAGVAFAVAPAANADSNEGMRCYGEKVVRCSLIRLDPDDQRIRAVGDIGDVRCAEPCSVRANNVRLQRYSSGSWRTVASAADNDGWHTYEDVARSPWHGYYNGLYRAVTTFYWTGGNSQTVVSKTFCASC